MIYYLAILIAVVLFAALVILVWAGLSQPRWKLCPRCSWYHSSAGETRAVLDDFHMIADEELCPDCKEVEAQCDCHEN